MTEDEKTENDWKFDGSKNKDEKRAKGYFPHNPLDYFDCPVCKCRRHVKKGDMHRISVMDDGTEIVDF